ncbi:Calnexin-like protein [Hibiscus syriacus]|uniref:Calnexin-like protein n=1 Tax=Hibiscus syriacus TaxID=106335 RepID=A0A6A2XM55_HIBSY|nr:Calnexin-like protein [Hibiscus syriacus]
MKNNPAYKGKWSPSLIDNPNYKGIWKAREIPNPNYFELEKPNFEPISGIGIEIWTMQDGILFDNILIAKNEKVAKSYRETKWKPKFEVEKERQKAEDDASGSDFLAAIKRKVFDFLYEVADMPLLSNYRTQILDHIEKAEKQPNLAMGILVSIAVIMLTILLKLIFGGKNQTSPKEDQKAVVVETKHDEATSSERKEEEDETTAAPRRRRRET